MYSIKKRNNLWFAFLFVVLSALFPRASLALPPVDWAISTIDTGGVGLYTSIAVDSNNHVHISYYDGTNHALKYATNAPGDWAVSTIDSTGDVGQFSSIAVDSNNHVHISYYDGTNHALKYATNAPGDWAVSTIDSTGDVGQFSSIAVDSNNHVHISYYDGTNHALKYATNAPGDWAVSTIDSTGDAGQFSSIAVDSNNHVHISYYDGTNHALKYATNAPGDWAMSTIDIAGDAGQFSSIAVDSNNKVHISYYAVGYQVHAIGILKYATNTSGYWVTSTIDTGDVKSSTSIGVGLYTSIAVDSSNIVHISYYDGTSHALKYAENTPGSLFISTIDSTGDVGQFSSITVDSNNYVHISYLDYTNGGLKYAESSAYCSTVLPPNPASPANGVTGISTTPTVGWSRVSGVTTYSLQVCSDSACNNVVASTSALTNNWWTVSSALNNNMQYWWRVKAGNSCGNSSQWSGTATFTTMTLQQSTTWTPKISVIPLSINFGSVPVGGTSKANKRVTINNSGNEDFVITSITITGADQFKFIQNCSIVAAKSLCPIGVIFSPVAPFGKKSGIMSISFNDPKKTTINVKLSGQAPPPKISVSPKSLRFASVRVGNTSLSKTITIKNTGTSDLVIDNITITGANADGFSQTNSCNTIARGGVCRVNVTFAPELPGSRNNAILSIPSNDPKNAIINVKLSGVGK